MKRNYCCAALLALLFITTLPLSLSAQDTTRTIRTLPNLFLDCFRCYQTYLKENIDIVNFVRNKDVAQIQLLVTRERTANGVEWTLRFIGYEDLKQVRNTVTYFSPETDTFQEERAEFTRHVRIGLIPFITQTPFIDNIEISYQNPDGGEGFRRVDDPWNHWVFDIGVSASLEGRETLLSYSAGGRISADRVTKEWKIDIGAFGNYEYTRLQFEDDSTGEVQTIDFIESFKEVEALVVKSLTAHWSVGGSASVSSSTFSNTAFRIGIGPALEYNIFPYREYNRHELSFLFELSPFYVRYNETTIYNKTDQFLVQPSLSVDYELVETWGSVEASAEASAYLHNLSRNRLELRGEIDYRIIRGLSFSVEGFYALVNDQLSIPKGNISDRRELLRLREQLTGYEFGVEFGLEFTFGSIYSNIVNPRIEQGRFD